MSEGGPGASIEEERLRQLEPRTGWWWLRGSVNGSCFCFSLLTGVYLLSLLNMATGLMYLLVKKGTIPLIAESIKMAKESDEKLCLGIVVSKKEFCDKLERNITKSSEMLDFVEGAVPMYYVIGAVYVFFSLMGLRAGYTSNPACAKIFALAFPVHLTIDLVYAALSPTKGSLGYVVMDTVILAYFFKVAWSFYVRLKIAEELRRGSSISDGGGRTGSSNDVQLATISNNME